MDAARRPDALGRGVYSAGDAIRLINFQRSESPPSKRVSRQTIGRWLAGYDFDLRGKPRHSPPLWRPDYPIDEPGAVLEVSFRDLIELRFVKAFRDWGLSLQAIRECFTRAVEAVHDERPFSTRRFRTDGKTIFLEITDGVREGELLDLKSRQKVFHRVVAPSFRELEFDAEIVARWFPLGLSRKTVVIDPARAFGRPILVAGSVPTEVIVQAVKVEGSPEKVARIYEVPLPAVRDAVDFERQLAA